MNKIKKCSTSILRYKEIGIDASLLVGGKNTSRGELYQERQTKEYDIFKPMLRLGFRPILQ